MHAAAGIEPQALGERKRGSRNIRGMLPSGFRSPAPSKDQQASRHRLRCDHQPSDPLRRLMLGQELPTFRIGRCSHPHVHTLSMYAAREAGRRVLRRRGKLQ